MCECVNVCVCVCVSTSHILYGRSSQACTISALILALGTPPVPVRVVPAQPSTTVRDQTLHPEWRGETVYLCSLIGDITRLRRCHLLLIVRHQSKSKLGSDSVLGEAVVPLRQLMNNGGGAGGSVPLMHAAVDVSKDGRHSGKLELDLGLLEA